MTDRSKKFILWFDEVGMNDVGLVGGKNAALGEMVSGLIPLGISVPNGFTVTAHAYNCFINEASLRPFILETLTGLNTHHIEDLQKRGLAVRTAILAAEMPADLKKEIVDAYHKISDQYGGNTDVAVRSSATAEDLPGASFAGQQETYLNVVGDDAVLESVKKAFASLFTDRAISYREDKGFAHTAIALSVGVQKMVRSDLASSGVAFSIDTETGFDKVVVINSSYGLGEMIVQGKVTPDEFIVFKSTLKDFRPIISKTLGKKDKKMIYTEGGTLVENTSPADTSRYSLSDEEILKLARWVVQIEEYFSEKNNHYQPMDIEWAKDGNTGELFIVQARPETVRSLEDRNVYKEYALQEKGEVLTKGSAVGSKIATGIIRVIHDTKDIGKFQQGDILVTEMTDPDWEPIMKIASAIITDKGGRTSHAAILSRELGIPAIVGTGDASNVLETGTTATVDCSSGSTGFVYRGTLAFTLIEHRLDTIPRTTTKVMVNIGTSDEAFRYHALPVSGVGLGRLEFIIASHIKIHPNALIHFNELRDGRKHPELITHIENLTVGYDDKKQFYIDTLAQGIGMIGATFWPNPVIIRFSDFKTNEYRKLIGGELYEPEEENPMLGWRGASRYYHPDFKEAFGLECTALKKAREEFGLSNIIPMVPFCRTPDEGLRVVATMKEFGLDRETDQSLKIYMMCEIPSNILLDDEFLNIFDGMSIGSNDLTQLTLGLDRDSQIVDKIANENDPSVKQLIEEVIKKTKARGKYIGICGQAPSDFPEFTEFLVEQHIDSISLNPDTVIKTLSLIAEKESARS
ncbi:MAG: phosphoenolpyruvate synthase [Candidatus Yonathbacteria bacterium RIFCSPLOWO2_01_FULL_47_33b]|uniref:Phosphoenolpyruvate synthase n=1 Tax=Candidatus Yonathbacteria bacterium RIFCSPLOWO2_01_FULL_47_33b TaxID=1802727 RepID=A0A1G2SGZ4_9BACT|nr:MAG: phosphoenolpyruvate synthase [Candidatus Yonathbacteria bacterium RIFCSPLOWO2_01_FULL_47_33b]